MVEISTYTLKAGRSIRSPPINKILFNLMVKCLVYNKVIIVQISKKMMSHHHIKKNYNEKIFF